MMQASFQAITLDTGDTDEEAVLVLKGGRLAAVLSHLSDMHGELAGLWFVEALFGRSPRKFRHTFASPDEFAVWLDANGA